MQDYKCIWEADEANSIELTSLKLEWDTFEDFVKAVRTCAVDYMKDIWEKD